ncbi:hypothetical protein AVEN_187349-1 [Araneus ventricosus]|uniref:Uncharacterized protein n=1 Tax=Araneus ventricosus TaxID=182803 RepID=A0A4Y2Q4T6_ARAVE|nr:hypothetical protein AVEN_187349-1 [Araneus ventricosus]
MMFAPVFSCWPSLCEASSSVPVLLERPQDVSHGVIAPTSDKRQWLSRVFGVGGSAGCTSVGDFGPTSAGNRRFNLPFPGSGPTIALRWAYRALPRGLVSDHPWGSHA